MHVVVLTQQVAKHPPVVCFPCQPSEVGERIGGKKSNSWVEIKLFTKKEKRKRIIVMTIYTYI